VQEQVDVLVPQHFLGLGAGLGSAMIVDGILEPMELAHLPYKNGRTYEDYVGTPRVEAVGKKEMAMSRDRCGGASQGRLRRGVRHIGRRKFQEHQEAATGLLRLVVSD
jgi:hypothetical protein